jgi:hypothetical protein
MAYSKALTQNLPGRETMRNLMRVAHRRNQLHVMFHENRLLALVQSPDKDNVLFLQ